MTIIIQQCQDDSLIITQKRNLIPIMLFITGDT